MKRRAWVQLKPESFFGGILVEMKKKARLLFVGDSITDSNRNREAILGGWSSFGDGYVSLINAYTTAKLPEKELMVINKGNSGDTIVDLKTRWQEDVLALNPDVVTIKIGINDIWRQFDAVFYQEDFVTIERYEAIYRELIEQTLKEKIQVVLIAPFMVEPNIQDAMRQMVEAYKKVVQALAQEYQLVYCDAQGGIDQFLQYQSSYVLSNDRVHVTSAGHLLIAEEWLKKTLGKQKEGE